MPFDQSTSSFSTGVRTSCRACPTKTVCLADSASPAELDCWDAERFPHVLLPAPGKLLFATGDSATAIFVVRSGCLKTFTVDADGNERVRGFHFPGDLVGLDALGSARYPSQAVAVTPAQVCRISKGQLHRLQQTAPALISRLLECVGDSLQQALALSGDYTADQRVAAFLLQMQGRMQDGAGIELPMTRRDIANYLRLATETVCRVLTRFERKRMIGTQDRRIQLRDASALQKLARPVGLAPVALLQRAA
jgi:CRP/FNR family transcriptional regulator, anaerobic regulatory protein